LKDPILPFNVR